MRLSAQSRLALIKAVESGNKTVVQACREVCISRKTFYKWYKRYQEAPSKEQFTSLKDKNWELQYHAKKTPAEIERFVLNIVAENPNLGYQAIRKSLAQQKGFNLSKHGIQNILGRYAVNSLSAKVAYKENKKRYGLTPQERYLIFVRTIKEGKPVSSVCRNFGISRKTYYKWYKRYKNLKRLNIDTFKNAQWRIELHPRRIPEDIEKKIISAIIKSPELSTHKLAGAFGVGNHGVQNILARNNLNLYEKRLAYSQTQPQEAQIPTSPTFVDRVRSVFEQFVPSLAPAPPPRVDESLRVEAGPPVFSTIFNFLKVFISSAAVTSATLYSLIWWVGYVSGQTGAEALGILFASVALIMGSVFFLYSLKYYITLAIVLSFSQGESTQGIQQSAQNGKKKGFLSWILGIGKGNGNGNGSGNASKGYTGPLGLEPNLEHVTLKRHPFISVHIPFYNEKNVVERIIAATTNFDYKGEYEVILCDDSTDETTKIIQDYLSVNSLSLSTRKNQDEGWELTWGEVRPGVTLKHLHRTSREGFKGGALRLALKLTDPRTEFISVFDADFVPYPDTLELFLKYFQVTAGTLDANEMRMEIVRMNSNKDIRINSHDTADSHKFVDGRIAAIQGYQWHVLNKSENWITRGVRSEYAGSYVIERSGTEIYSGLKQISGAVYMIRKDVLEEVGWGTSLTEDFELTLRLYAAGYRVVYTPYIQAPAECVSTIKRLIRQRMRWAEGHSNNIRKMFWRLMFGRWEKISTNTANDKSELKPKPYTLKPTFIPSPLTLSEKLEFLYLSPYYLQAFFFLLGTLSWLISETIFQARLPFWTSLWGWSLVLTNMLSLPLMNAVGLFLEESEERDYQGIFSFVILSYIMVPFQAYAALKGFLEKEEGPWFRTPKTGRITDIFTRGRFYRFISGILPGRTGNRVQGIGYSALNPKTYNLHPNPYLSLATANNRFQSFRIRPSSLRWIGKSVLAVFLIISMTLVQLAGTIMVSTGLPTAGGAFAIGSEEGEGPPSHEATEGQGQVQLTDNRKDVVAQSESSNRDVSPAITVEEHNPQTHPEDFYLQNESGDFTAYRVVRQDGNISVETKSKDGIQKIEFESSSLDIRLSEKTSESIDFVPKAVSSPIFEFQDEQGNWQEYVALIPNELSAQENETYAVVRSGLSLIAPGVSALVPASVELTIGERDGKPVSKFAFRLGENNHTNRLKWRTNLTGLDSAITQNVYDLREEVNPELEEYFAASLLGTQVSRQEFENLEIDWKDFVANFTQEPAGERLYCSLTTDLALLPRQYPLRVEQSKNENANTVYFYPYGKQGALTIDPTLSLSTPGSTVQIDVPNRYRAIMNTGDTNDYLVIKDRAEDDTAPDEIVRLNGAYIFDENVEYHLKFDANRKTTILESTNTRIKLRVEGCLDTSAGGACLKDVVGGNDEVIEVAEEYTFTTEGAFTNLEVDFKGGIQIDYTTYADEANGFQPRFNQSSTTHSTTILYGDGESESSTSSDGGLGVDKYVTLQGTGNYQDIIFGLTDLNGNRHLSNSSSATIYYNTSAGWVTFVDTAQTLIGKGDAQFFVQFQSQSDLDTEAERESLFNDLTNPDSLSYGTGGEWDDAPASPGLNFESSSSQYVSAADSVSLSVTGDLTVEAWIKPESTTASNQFDIAGKWDGSNQSYLLAQYGDEIRFYVDAAANYETTDAANLQTGTWYHVLAEYDASAQIITIYVNGTEQASSTTGTIPSSIGDDAGQFLVGAEKTSGTIDKQIGVGTDDARETMNGADFASNIAYVSMNQASTPSRGGFRFQNVTIPQGATIAAATAQLWPYASNADSPHVDISVENVDNSNDFATEADVASRPTVAVSTSWIADDIPSQFNTTPDFSSAAQLLVNRSGWSSGNALTLLVTGHTSGTIKYFESWSYDGDTTKATKLHIEYTNFLNFYDGLIDEVRVYDHTLSPSEIQETMNEQIDPVSAGLVGYWRFNENTGQAVHDETTNNNNGTLGASSASASDDPTWTTGYVPDGYNEAEGAYTVDAGTSSDTNIWWDRNWTKRKKITFNNSAQSTALIDFPVLVKLDSTRIDYSSTQSAGQDLRFVDADGRTVLKHEIEEFNESGNDWVWVRVPQIDASSGSDYIWMYYGNASAAAPPSTHGEETWDSNFKGVWHLKESGSPPATWADSTSNARTLTSRNNPIAQSSGKIAGSMETDTTDNDAADTPDQVDFDAAPFTISAWIRPTELPSTSLHDGYYIVKLHSAAPWESWMIWANDTDNLFQLVVKDNNQTWFGTYADAAMSINTWYHIVGTIDNSKVVRLYINGTQQTSTNTLTTTPAVFPSDSVLTIGVQSGVSPAAYFDEVRFSNTTRSAGWIAASYKSESDTFNTYGSEEDYTTYSPTASQNAASIASFDLDGGANASTLVNDAGLTAGDTSFTVDSTTGFASSGVAYIEGDKFSYTGTTSTTFTGIPASGELSVIGHADNSVVASTARHDPQVKLRGWRDINKPSSVSLESATLFEGTDYNVDLKPFTTSYFAQDLTWYSTLESSSAATSPNVGSGDAVYGTTTFTTGKYGNGALFDADAERIGIPTTGGDSANFNKDKGTIEFWYKPLHAHTDNTQHDFAMRWVDSSNTLLLYKNSSNQLVLEFNDNGTWRNTSVTSSNYSWKAGEWVHLRFTWDKDASAGETMRIFINGTEPTHTTSSDYTGSYTGDAVLTISVFNAGRHSDGVIDEFRIYSTALGSDPISKGGNAADADEYLADTTNDYTFDFNDDDASNRGEYLWLGSDSAFTGVNYQLTTKGTGSSADFDWDYWDGDSWAALTTSNNVVNSASFETTTGSFYFDQPGDWRPYSVNGSTDLYYIRGHLEGGTLSDFTESVFYTDILLLQYLSDISSADQTFVLTSAPIIQSIGTIQVDVPNRYRMIMQTGDTYDYIWFYDRAQNDSSPNNIAEFEGGPRIKEEDVFYFLGQNANRKTTILESNTARVRLRVEGCLDTDAGGACLTDGTDKVTVVQELTFTTEGMFSNVEYDFHNTGITLDSVTYDDTTTTLQFRFNNPGDSSAYSEAIVYGDGETEGTRSTNGSMDPNDDTYVVAQATGSYQDIIMGTMNLNGDKVLSNGSNGTNWYSVDLEAEADRIDFYEEATQTLVGKGSAQFFVLFKPQSDLDTEAEREAVFNDMTNPDILSYGTGGEWDDAPASPGLEFDGSNDYVSAGVISLGSSAGTMHALVKFDNNTGSRYAIGRNYDWEALGVTNDGGFRALSRFNGSFCADYDTTLSTGIWYDLTGTYDGSNVRLYVNGQLVETCVQTGTLTQSEPWAIGANQGGAGASNRWFDGVVDEVRLYSYTLTQAEIQEAMNKQIDPNTPGLVGYWRLNENTGQTAHDETTNNYDGRLGTTTGSDSADPTWTGGYVPDFYNEAEGAYTMEMNTPSKALNFDGSDYASVSDNATLDITSQITLSAWVKVDNATTTTSEIITGKQIASDWDLVYALKRESSDEKFEFLIRSGGSYYKARATGTTIAAGTWYHLVGTFDGTNLKIYVNGTEAGSTARTGTIETTNNPFYIGIEPLSAFALDGTVDDVRIYNTALSQSEIQASMNGPLVGNESNLVGYWKFDEGRGQIAHDASNNGNDGVLGANFAVGTDDPTWTSGHVGPKLNMAGFDIDGGSNTSTLVNDAALAAGDTSFTVDSTTGFPDGAGTTTNYAYIEGDKFAYTDTTATTFTGIPASGEFSVIGHADNSVVSLMNRRKPFYKIRNYRDAAAPSEVTLEGSTLTDGTDYNAEIKPFSDAYFAQDLTMSYPLESTTADVGGNLTNSGCSFAAGRYGKGLECDTDAEDANVSISEGTDYEKEKGTVEFWYQPYYNYNDSVRHYIFSLRFDESNEILMNKSIGNDLVFSYQQGGTNVNYTVSAGNFSWSAYDWVHIRAEWDDSESTSTQQRVYLNGVEPTHTDSGTDLNSTSITSPTTLFIGNTTATWTEEANGIIDEFRIYNTDVGPDPIAKGGDTADSDEYLADTANDYTFDFNDDDASNRGEYVWIGSDSRFAGANVNLATNGVDNGAIFADDFESGGFTNWTTTSTDGGDLSVLEAAAFSGTYGMQAVIDDTNTIRAADEINPAVTEYRVRFAFNPNSLTMAESDKFELLLTSELYSPWNTSFMVELNYISSAYTLYAKDSADGAWRNTAGYTLTNEWHLIEVDWKASTGPGSNNGEFSLWIDGKFKETVTGVDSDTETVGYSSLGALDADSGTSGTIYFDDFASWNRTMDYDWEYWNGTAWSALTIAGVHGLRTDAFLDSGSFFFTAPGDWRPYSMNGSTDLYYIRGHLEGGTYSTDPIEDTVKTDILLVQYLSSITSNNQTFVTVPENLWLWFGLAPVLPLIIRRRRRKEAIF